MPMLGARVGPADSQIPLLQMVAMKPHDWTYSTTFAGTTRGWKMHSGHPPNRLNAHHSIPIAMLSRSDRNLILFYAEIPLFDHKLHDNGASHLLVCFCGDDTNDGSGNNSGGNRRLQRPIQPTTTELQRRGDDRPQQQPQGWNGCETTAATETSTTMTIQ
ncbi:hypothetical protein EDB86DRAFT_2931798 [Lactarius hatsudake]|nr:hypothetical protein EDB86DRAFT_2931798 [Lactarius hatsudake]